MLIHKASGQPLHTPLLAFYTIAYKYTGELLDSMPDHYREPVQCLAAMQHEEMWAIIYGKAGEHAGNQP
jgi:hypothetical protein